MRLPKKYQYVKKNGKLVSAVEPQWQDDDLYFDVDIYNEEGINDYLENDEISAEEEGFMSGYLGVV